MRQICLIAKVSLTLGHTAGHWFWAHQQNCNRMNEKEKCCNDPDLNLTEMPLCDLNRAVHKWILANLNKAKQSCTEEWAKLPPQQCDRQSYFGQKWFYKLQNDTVSLVLRGLHKVLWNFSFTKPLSMTKFCTSCFKWQAPFVRLCEVEDSKFKQGKRTGFNKRQVVFLGCLQKVQKCSRLGQTQEHGTWKHIEERKQTLWERLKKRQCWQVGKNKTQLN